MDYEFPYTQMLQRLIEYLNNHKFQVEDKDQQYFLHFCAITLEEIVALLGMLQELATIIKVLNKLPT